MKKINIVTLCLLFVGIEINAQDNSEELPVLIAMQCIQGDYRVELYCVTDPEQTFTLPCPIDEYFHGSYDQLLNAPSYFGDAHVFFHWKTGDTIISYSLQGFLHVGNSDRDKILKRIYLDGQEHDYTEIGRHYFDRTRKGLNALRPRRESCCTVS